MKEICDYLAACPCCGGTPEMEKDEWGTMVRCVECGLNTGGEFQTAKNEKKAIDLWNKRQTKMYTQKI